MTIPMIEERPPAAGCTINRCAKDRYADCRAYHSLLVRRGMPLLLATVFSVSGLLGVFARSAAMGQEAREVVAPVFAEPAQTKLLKATAVGFGKVQPAPASVVSVESPRDGLVQKVEVRAGQTVEQGAALADFITAAATRETYRKAKSELDFAKINVGRMRRLYSSKAVSQKQLEQAEVAFKNAQASLDALTRIGAQMQRETIRAPISGTVTAVSVSEGDRVKQGAKLLTLAPSNAVAVLLGIEPEDVVKVSIGMPVLLTNATDSTQMFAGQVTAVNNVLDSSTRLVDVMVRIEQQSSHPPLIGAYMRGDIAFKEETVLAVPRAALLYDRDGVYLFVVKDGSAHRVAVQPGLENDVDVAITGQVEPGELVVVQGNYELIDGMKVRLVTSEVQ